MHRTTASLVEISALINSVLELDRLLETIIDAAIEAIGVERGILFLKAPDGSLEARVARNVERETLANAEEISKSITNEVADSGRYVLSSNIQDDPKLMARASVKAFKILSVLCVPLIHKENIIGSLYLDSRKATKVFTEEDVQFLKAFADLAAIAIPNALLYDSSRREAGYWKKEAAGRYGADGIIHAGGPVAGILDDLPTIARSTVSVLITGESGTGKELIARALHYESPRREKKFVPINCSALPEDILEAELFGAKKGSYTGAVADTHGLFEEANGGTIFFDEIADMQPSLQAKLLRALQDGEIRRVGDTQYRYIDVRSISATNKDIREEMSRGNFREDLYYRLCGVEIHVPPLRERAADIAPLVQNFVRRYCEENGLALKHVTPGALRRLEAYPFPGNVRELQNIVRKAVLLSRDEISENALDLQAAAAARAGPEDFDGAIREHIVRALKKTEWNQTRAAELLGLSRTTLQAKMKKLKISRR